MDSQGDGKNIIKFRRENGGNQKQKICVTLKNKPFIDTALNLYRSKSPQPQIRKIQESRKGLSPPNQKLQNRQIVNIPYVIFQHHKGLKPNKIKTKGKIFETKQINSIPSNYKYKPINPNTKVTQPYKIITQKINQYPLQKQNQISNQNYHMVGNVPNRAKEFIKVTQTLPIGKGNFGNQLQRLPSHNDHNIIRQSKSLDVKPLRSNRIFNKNQESEDKKLLDFFKIKFEQVKIKKQIEQQRVREANESILKMRQEQKQFFDNMRCYQQQLNDYTEKVQLLRLQKCKSSINLSQLQKSNKEYMQQFAGFMNKFEQVK